jgi:DedD protein
MDQGLKERLVGAAVLVAIAVWLIPWVLDGPEAPLESGGSSLQLPAAEEPMPMRTQTLRLGDAPESGSAAPSPVAPTPPPAEPVAAAEPPPATPAAVTEDEPAETPAVAAVRPESERAAPVTTTPPPAAPPATARTPPKPTASAAPAASGDWIVQLGSFGEEANARRLAQQSGTFGYKAEVSSYQSGGRTLYRVRVGPAKSRAAADATASALKAHGIKDARVVAAR